MQIKGYISALIRLWMISMVCHTVVSCNLIWSEESLDPECAKGTRQTIVLNLAISHPDASINTRATEDYELSFTRNEAAVKSLTAFIVDLNQDGTENYDKVEYFSTQIDPVDFYKGIYIYRQSVEVKTGSKHIYVGANLKEEHIQAFILNKPLSLEGEGPAVNMVMTPDPTHSGQGTDIAMFGQILTKDGAKDITISEDNDEYYLSGDLERLTAKVLLTCMPDENDGDTAFEEGCVARQTADGWVKISEIRYTLNVTNRSTYIDKRINNTHNINIDPNWNIGNYVLDEGGSIGKADGHTGEFDAYESDEIIERLWDDRFSTFPQPYDSKKVGANSSEHYTEGLYCLENTSFNNIGLSGSLIDDAARLTTTHVVLAVRFIPRYFVGGWNDNTDCQTYSRALDTIFITGDDQGSGPYSNGTYWTRVVDGQLKYYAWTGVKREISKNAGLTIDDFTRYDGGWSYFTTFVDGDISDTGTKLTYAEKEAWGVQRDHYYILAIDKITRPGSPIPWDEFIRVNSITTNWVDRGSQDITIRPM